MSLFPKAPFDLSVLPIYVAGVPAAPFSLLPSQLYLLSRHSRFLDSSIEAVSRGKRCQEQARGS